MANKVGYRSPPAQSRFKKGQSGNPTGRRKGARSFRTVLDEQMQDTIELTISGRKRRVKTIDAVIMSLKAGSIKGDPRQQANLLRALRDADLLNAEDTTTKPLTRDERAILRNYQARILRQAEAVGWFDRAPVDDKPKPDSPANAAAAAPVKPGQPPVPVEKKEQPFVDGIQRFGGAYIEHD